MSEDAVVAEVPGRHVLASGCGAVSTFLADPATVVAPDPSVPSTLAVEIARRSGAEQPDGA
ncbi:MAG TPA: hypothetical protein VIT87_02910 [Gemmatimonadales bacterium]